MQPGTALPEHACAGAALPLFTLVFGSTLNALGADPTNNVAGFQHQVRTVCLDFTWLALGAGFASYVQLAFWMWAGAASLSDTACADCSLLRRDKAAVLSVSLQACISASFPRRSTSFLRAGTRQTDRIRRLYLQSSLRLDVEYFDLHASTGNMMQVGIVSCVRLQVVGRYAKLHTAL